MKTFLPCWTSFSCYKIFLLFFSRDTRRLWKQRNDVASESSRNGKRDNIFPTLRAAVPPGETRWWNRMHQCLRSFTNKPGFSRQVKKEKGRSYEECLRCSEFCHKSNESLHAIRILKLILTKRRTQHIYIAQKKEDRQWNISIQYVPIFIFNGLIT